MSIFFRCWCNVCFFIGMVALVQVNALSAGIQDNLELLRDRCLYFSVGRAPNDPNTGTIRHDLWSQSPFSPDGEIDMASTGFALAALPAAVEKLIEFDTAQMIAELASSRLLEMVQKSADAGTPEDVAKYGKLGMLYHFYIWNDTYKEFHGKENTEVSIIDSVLAFWGLHVSAQYFRDNVLSNYQEIKKLLNFSAWLDTTTPGHENQFRMSYKPESGFSGYWDWMTQEVFLINIFAAYCEPNINLENIWNAWTRDEVTYTSLPPDPKTFSCFATWNGDPFTVYYALLFLPLDKFPADFNGVNWFNQNQIAYLGHVEFYKKERGYLDAMTYSLLLSSGGPVAEPKSSPDTIPVQTHAPIHSVAGGILYYDANADNNILAQTLSTLVQNPTNLFGWDGDGWPVAAVDGTDPTHAKSDESIIGQDISAIAISIENFLNHRRIQNLVLQDQELCEVLNQLFPPRPGDVSGDGVVTAYDASIVLQYLVGLTILSPEQQEAADVTDNGNITALDAALILQYTVGLITKFPVQGAPILVAKDENQLLTIIIAELENSSLSTEQKHVLEQLRRLLWQQVLPKQTTLLQNYPNPFNPETWIPFQLAQNAPVTISICNAKGQLIRSLNIGNQKAGIYTTKEEAAYWDGRDSLGQKVASGVYYYTLKAGNFITTRKMVILK